MTIKSFIFILGFLLTPTMWVGAQSAYEELQAIVKAEVVEVVDEREDLIYGTDAKTTIQTLKAKLLEGKNKGEVVTFENDLVMLDLGDRLYLSHVRDIKGIEIYIVKDVDRFSGFLYLVGLFLLLIVVFARWQGVRAVLSLALSIGAIIFLLIPALLAGKDPVLYSLFISAIILAIVLFGTHGFNAVSTTAFVGTSSAVLVTSLVAWYFVDLMRLSGFGSDASVYLNFATNGNLDFAGLLLGSIIIGILGVLDDVAITQASVVEELKAVNQDLGLRELYLRGIKVGRDHVGSLINTLALAYVGAALPLVLLFGTSEATITFTLNQEVIASEMARIIVGSIGLLLAVPFTTLIASWWFSTHSMDPTKTAGHSHGHHHGHHGHSH